MGLLSGLFTGCGRTSLDLCTDVEDDRPFALHCSGLAGCEATLSLPVEPPGVLLVLDRSASMRVVENGVSKWSEAIQSIDRLTREFEDIHWGLTAFPDQRQTACAQGDIPIPVGADRGPEIRSYLELPELLPTADDSTNVPAALFQAFHDPALRDPDRLNALLLISDGATTCRGPHQRQNTHLVREMWEKEGIRTFVVGFGVGVDVDLLTALAEFGGAPLEGNVPYHRAGRGQLVEQLSDVIQQELQCAFPLDIDPGNVGRLMVTMDGQPVQASVDDGWTFDRGRLRFSGDACETLKRYEVGTVDVSLRCQ